MRGLKQPTATAEPGSVEAFAAILARIAARRTLTRHEALEHAYAHGLAWPANAVGFDAIAFAILADEDANDGG